MRFYPIHIIIKDTSFFFIHILLSGLYDTVDTSTIFWLGVFSLRMMGGIIFWNLTLQTVLYFGLRHYLRFRSGTKLFFFGTSLHLLTILFCLRSIWSDQNELNLLVSLGLSSIISGLIYLLLNGRRTGSLVKKLILRAKA